MWPIVNDRLTWSLGLSVTVVSPAKTTEPIEMPFALWAQMGRGIMYQMRIQIHPWEGAILGERSGPLKSIGTV